MSEYRHPAVWYWTDEGLWFKQGEVIVGPVTGTKRLALELVARLGEESGSAINPRR